MTERKHKRTCAVCHGKRYIAQKVRNPKTGKIETHQVTCYGCGGSGEQ